MQKRSDVFSKVRRAFAAPAVIKRLSLRRDKRSKDVPERSSGMIVLNPNRSTSLK